MAEHGPLDCGIANALTDAFQQVLHARGDVTLALLFGSRARGDAGESSDADIALLAPSADLLEIGAELSRVSGLAVDVISLEDPGVPLLDELLQDAVVVFEAWPGAYATWRSCREKPGRRLHAPREQGVITAAVARALRKAVGLRNVVAHGYARVDPAAIHFAATQGLTDLEAFSQAVASWAALQFP